MKYRKVELYESYNCDEQIGWDQKDGPIKCGNIAAFITPTKDGFKGLCKKHPPPKERR